MNIQIAGITGMLGGAVSQAARKRGHAVTATRDITQTDAADIVAPVVINCAGLVKQRQEPASRMMLVNAYGPHRLADACDAAGARLIHVSTDCVFQEPGPHAERDEPDTSDIYAISKRAGEISRHPHLTIRTSFVGFGRRGLLAELQAGGTVKASGRLLWSGHTVDTIADLLVTLAERPSINGLLHVPGDYQSRWSLCQKLVARYELPAQVIRDDAYEADRRLVSDYWAYWGLPELPSFTAQLAAMERP